MQSRKVYVVWALFGVGLLATLLTGTAGPSVTETAAQSSELPSLLLASPITGLTQPVSITHAGDGSGRIFVVQQNGQIRIIRNGTLVFDAVPQRQYPHLDGRRAWPPRTRFSSWLCNQAIFLRQLHQFRRQHRDCPLPSEFGKRRHC